MDVTWIIGVDKRGGAHVGPWHIVADERTPGERSRTLCGRKPTWTWAVKTDVTRAEWALRPKCVVCAKKEAP